MFAEKCIGISNNKLQITNNNINKLLEFVHKYNNSIHGPIKNKPFYNKPDTHINFDVEFITQKPKFKVGDHARVSKYKNIFGEGYQPNCTKKCFWLKMLNILHHGHMLLKILMVKKLLERFMNKNWKSLELKKW